MSVRAERMTTDTRFGTQTMLSPGLLAAPMCMHSLFGQGDHTMDAATEQISTRLSPRGPGTLTSPSSPSGTSR